MKKSFIFFLISALTFSSLRADEGMWLLPLLEKLNIATMQKMGCRLSAEDIYSINRSSIKDAIVIFGGGCTGEMISGEGLLLTNHHCGYDAIQQHSSLEHDYLSDGFWAKTKSEELHTPGLNATFLVRFEDVTDRVNARLNDNMTETERELAIDKIGDEISKAAIGDTHYTASVRSFFGGNNFYLVVYETFTDVRMVGVPPSSIGKFGDETDNWVWPRHTGDFGLFRVYAGADGKPANYSPGNVPASTRPASVWRRYSPFASVRPKLAIPSPAFFGVKLTVAPSKGTPSSVTMPLTGSVFNLPSEQPTTLTVAAKNNNANDVMV